MLSDTTSVSSTWVYVSEETKLVGAFETGVRTVIFPLLVSSSIKVPKEIGEKRVDGLDEDGVVGETVDGFVELNFVGENVGEIVGETVVGERDVVGFWVTVGLKEKDGAKDTVGFRLTVGLSVGD